MTHPTPKPIDTEESEQQKLNEEATGRILRYGRQFMAMTDVAAQSKANKNDRE